MMPHCPLPSKKRVVEGKEASKDKRQRENNRVRQTKYRKNEEVQGCNEGEYRDEADERVFGRALDKHAQTEEDKKADEPEPGECAEDAGSSRTRSG